MKYSIEGKSVRLSLSGASITGNDLCLLDHDDNLIAGCSWESQGYVVASMLDNCAFEVLQKGVFDLVREALLQAGAVLDESFSLDQYHSYCDSQQMHLSVIEFLRGRAAIENFPIDYRLLDDKVSEVCEKQVSCKVQSQIASGFFFIRLVRPMPCQDYNPPHKDVWIDRLRHGLNLYLPLAGSDENSSLALVPGSHLWNESVISRTLPGTHVNGVAFSVPSVVMPDDALKMDRPKVVTGQALLFSPYLIHGGAVNFNRDTTRVSLEMRFWRCAS